MEDRKKYFKDVKKVFPCNGKKEKKYLHEIHQQISDYTEDKKDCTYSDLEERFGTPLEVVVAYYETIDTPYLLKRLKMRKMIFTTCCIIVVIALFSMILWAISLRQSYHDFQNRIPCSYEEIITEEN